MYRVPDGQARPGTRTHDPIGGIVPCIHIIDLFRFQQTYDYVYCNRIQTPQQEHREHNVQACLGTSWRLKKPNPVCNTVAIVRALLSLQLEIINYFLHLLTLES
jgi:hypothetical protein